MGQPGTKIPLGTVLAGKYRITREIGRGGMASVYEAENVDIGKRVAIKVLAQELTTSAVVVERFLREARAAAAIRSPYICDVYDSGRLVEDDRPFLVLELLEGESLFERLSVVPFLDVESTVAIMTQVCRGLTKAHAANIVHRDLKPENIFLTKDEEGLMLAKILDFGLAKFYAPLTGPENKAQARLTREGAVFGTPAYMSPEQVRGQGAVDHRADLWALGCITYECLTGKTVWKTEQGVAMTFAQIASSALPDPSDVRPDLPASFMAWFEKALSRDLERRFQTAKEFSEGLVGAFGGRGAMPEVDRLVRSLPPPRSSGASLQGAAPLGGAGNGGGQGGALDDGPTELAAPPNLDMIRFPGHAPMGSIPMGAPSLPASPGMSGQSQPGPGAPPMAPKFGPPPQAGPHAPGAYGGGGPASGPMSGDRLTASPFRPRRSKVGWVLAGVTLVLAGAAAYAGWVYVEKTETPATTGGSASADPGTPPQSPSSAANDAGARAALPWMPAVWEAQQTVANGDLKNALKMLKEAYEKGGHGVPRTMLEQVQIGITAVAAKSPCALTGIARPRTYDLMTPPAGTRLQLSPAGRPSIVGGPRGPVMAWTDNHAGGERVYTALLDKAMRGVEEPNEVTPESTSAARPELIAAGDKLVLLYWETRSGETGARARLLDAGGKPAGPPVVVANSGVRGSYASLNRARDGSFFAAWTKETELGCEDLFVSKLSPALEPQGSPTRATDFIPVGSGKPRVRYPAITTHGDAIYTAFRLEREPSRLAHLLRVPIADAGKGLEAAAGGQTDRSIGEMAILNVDKTKAEAPSIACSNDACFVVWHAELLGGVFSASFEGAKVQPAARKKLSKGTRPAVTSSPSGQVQAVWYESGRVVTAALGRDGAGQATKIARVISDQPTPSITAGTQPGEWYIAWLDYEAGHLEPYAARVQCR
jgi:serine/threonine-protein kinase